MALTVVDDFTTIDSTDTTASAINVGNINAPVLDGQIKVQGTNSWRSRVNNAGVSGVGSDTGTANVDITNDHIFIWARSLDFTTVNDGGWRIRIATGTGAANFGDFGVGNVDTARVTVSGFFNFCADPLKPFFAIGGTPPALTAVRTFVLISDLATASTRDTWFMDEIKRGTGITITGASGSNPGTGSSEIATNDKTNGRGTFIDLVGGYYILGRITIGNTAAVSSFDDENKVWVFQDMNGALSATFHKIEFVGKFFSINRATFGSFSGTGTAKEGSGGNIFVAGGVIPFRIEAIDKDTAVEFFGCSFTNSLTLRDDALRNFVVETNNGGTPTFIDDTRAANDSVANDANIWPGTPAVNDAGYFGHNERFSVINIDRGSTGPSTLQTYVGIWEYSKTSGWGSLTDVTDNTASATDKPFSNASAGFLTVTYAIPDDWDKQTVNGDNRYWIRVRLDSFSPSPPTTPSLTQVTVSMGGGVRWEQSSAEAIRCTFTNMDTIRIRNNAKFKKCIVTNSVAVAKSGAIDLGPTDPATDTFRDITVQNCLVGILLKGTSTGTTTYQFRNIKFANNTNDIRIDFPAAASVVVQVTEGGEIPTSWDNVNGSTFTAKSAVTVIVHIEDNIQNNIQGAQVYVQKSTPTEFTAGAGNAENSGTIIVTQTIDSDILSTGTCIVFDRSINATLSYRYASHDGANTFTLLGIESGTAAAGQVSSPTDLTTSGSMQFKNIEEGDTIKNTSDGSFAVVDRKVDFTHLITSPLQGGTNNLWQANNGYSLHTLATSLVSGVDTVDVPLFNGQTDTNGDITFVYSFVNSLPVVIRVRKNSPEFATRFEPIVSNNVITFQGNTFNIALSEDTVVI